jgi:DNA-binding transcriptional regulator GbsR (MarR family)
MELSKFEKDIYDALIRLGATSPDVLKSQDQIMGSLKLSKSQIGTAIIALEQKKIVKKITRGKRPGYYVENKIA